MKITSRKITVATEHVENALASYLKAFFPEAVAIEGIDLDIPMSKPGKVDLTVYFRQKAEDNQDVVKDDIPEKEKE